MGIPEKFPQKILAVSKMVHLRTLLNELLKDCSVPGQIAENCSGEIFSTKILIQSMKMLLKNLKCQLDTRIVVV